MRGSLSRGLLTHTQKDSMAEERSMLSMSQPARTCSTTVRTAPCPRDLHSSLDSQAGSSRQLWHVAGEGGDRSGEPRGTAVNSCVADHILERYCSWSAPAPPRSVPFPLPTPLPINFDAITTS